MAQLSPQEINYLQNGPQRDPVTLGPKYQNLLDANPYRNQSYNKSPWQKLLTGLGFRTEADAWQENMSVQAAEYDAAIAQKAYDEQYNQPSEQVARMNAAGLNPDITGGENINPGEAASPAQDPSTPMQSTGEESVPAQVVSWANGLMSAFSTALGMVQTFQGIHSNALDNWLKALGNQDDFQAFVRSVAPQLTPDSPETHILDTGEEQTWEYRAYQMAKLFAKKNLPRSYRQKFIDSITQFWNSAEAKPMVFGKWSEGIKAEKEYEGEYNTFYTPERRVLRTMYKYLGEAREQIVKLQMIREGQEASTATSEAELRETIAENTEGKELGKATTEEAKARSMKSQADSVEDEIRKILKSTTLKITKSLMSQGTGVADATAMSIELLQYLKGLL